MKPSGVFVIFFLFSFALTARAADATSPVDATQRNAPFAPGSAAAVTPEKQTPKDKANESLQEKRVEKTTVDRQISPLGERRSAIDVTETRDKNVREKASHRPEKIEQPTSPFNHRQASMSTGADTTKPPTVTKYQNSLTSASASNMARFPAIDGATNAKINRFVFRKNPAETVVGVEPKAATPVAGGSVLQK